MARRRKRLRAQMADWNHASREMRAAAERARTVAPCEPATVAEPPAKRTDPGLTPDGELTAGAKVFVARMAHHVAAGLSFDDAARAVIADDQRILAALCDANGDDRPGDMIRRELARDTYERLKARP